MRIYSKLSRFAEENNNKFKLTKTSSNVLRDVDLTRSTSILSN